VLCTPPERQIPLATYERFLGGRQGYLWSWLSGRAGGKLSVDLSGSLLPPAPANRPPHLICEGRFAGVGFGAGAARRRGSTPAPRRSGRLTVLAVAVEGVGDLRTDRS
jgi:hypothetical protein